MITFNEKDIPSFVIVNKVVQSVLPPISQNTLKVSGRAGEVDFGNEIGSRNIEVEITVVGANAIDLRGKVRQLGEWLYTEEPKKLIFHDEPDKFYMAKFTGDSDLDDILRIGQGTITFYCSDPYAYSTIENEVDIQTSLPDNPAHIQNDGEETFPKMRFEFAESTTNFNIISDDQFMRFGQPASVDRGAVDPMPLVFHDDMSSVTGWTQANVVDDGIIAGSFGSNGYSFHIADVGEGSKWHGPSGIKSLSRPVQDFKIQTRLAMHATQVGQLGRAEIYFLSENGVQLGKIALRNGNPHGITPYGQFKLGNRYAIQTYGSHAGAWKNWRYGAMELTRRDNRWFVYYAIIDPDTGQHHTRFYREYIDTERNHMGKIAQIQLHLAEYGTAPLVQTMNVSDIKVFEHVQTGASQDPYIFKAGDILEIDSETDQILLNGEPYYTSLDPSSQFITLEKGDNGIVTSPIVTSDAKVYFRERWL